jgi:hypothetical protein
MAVNRLDPKRLNVLVYTGAAHFLQPKKIIKNKIIKLIISRPWKHARVSPALSVLTPAPAGSKLCRHPCDSRDDPQRALDLDLRHARHARRR